MTSYCPCGAMLLENGCEECEHVTDGRDCLCEHCNPKGTGEHVFLTITATFVEPLSPDYYVLVTEE